MSERVKIEGIDVVPGTDPYRRDSGGLMGIELWINPEERRAGVGQYFPGQAVDADKWHNRIITARLGGDDQLDTEGPNTLPEADALRAYLESATGQELLSTVCDKHDIDWNGHNMVGHLPDVGQQALDDLVNAIFQLPAIEWQVWADIGDYYFYARREVISAETTDEEIVSLAEQWDAEAFDEHVIVDGDLVEYLTELRDELRGEEEGES